MKATRPRNYLVQAVPPRGREQLGHYNVVQAIISIVSSKVVTVIFEALAFEKIVLKRKEPKVGNQKRAGGGNFIHFSQEFQPKQQCIAKKTSLSTLLPTN